MWTIFFHHWYWSYAVCKCKLTYAPFSASPSGSLRPRRAAFLERTWREHGVKALSLPRKKLLTMKLLLLPKSPLKRKKNPSAVSRTTAPLPCSRKKLSPAAQDWRGLASSAGGILHCRRLPVLSLVPNLPEFLRGCVRRICLGSAVGWVYGSQTQIQVFT